MALDRRCRCQGILTCLSGFPKGAGIALDGSFRLTRLGGIGGEAVCFGTLSCVANLATYARRPVLRLLMQRLIGILAPLREQRAFGLLQVANFATCIRAVPAVFRLLRERWRQVVVNVMAER